MKISVLSFITFLFLLCNVVKGQFSNLEKHFISTDFDNRTPYNICTADIDGDGDKDVLVANYAGVRTQNNQIIIFKNMDGKGSFSTANYIQCENFVMMTVIHAADLDGDNDIDIIASDDSEQISWFENLDGQGNFSGTKVLTNNSAHTNCIKTADLDLDGDTDIICVSYFNTHSVFWFENLDGGGSFSGIKILYSDTSQWNGAENLIVDDFDLDGDIDIVALINTLEISKLYFLKNIGNAEFDSPDFLEEFSGIQSICGADINNDSFTDILAATENGILYLENSNGQTVFAPSITVAQTYLGTVFADDIDNDNDVDLLWANSIDRVNAIFNNGNGTFNSYQIINNSLLNPGVICTADFDNDGDKDILAGGGNLFPETIGEIVWFENPIITTSVEIENSELPVTFELFQNYPNPFNPSTTFKYSLPESCHVILKIFSLLGEEIEILINRKETAGEHQINWTPDNLSGGVYLALLRVSSLSKTIKLVLQK
ncbi:MAG: VCBS repeat-containing protein [bacterium]